MTKPLIQIGDEVREMTDSEYAQWKADQDEALAQEEAARAAADEKAAKRAAVLQKLGLNADEVAALFE